jgi:hypothetical protein
MKTQYLIRSYSLSIRERVKVKSFKDSDSIGAAELLQVF